MLPTWEESGCPRNVMVKAMDYGLLVSKFILQSRYYVHFQANTLGVGEGATPFPGLLHFNLDTYLVVAVKPFLHTLS